MTVLTNPEHSPRQSRPAEAIRRHKETCDAKAQAHIENIEFLLSWGTPIWEIPQRVNRRTTLAVERFLYRHDRGDLVMEMRRRDPMSMNHVALRRRRRSAESLPPIPKPAEEPT
ncbi:hypothetical protein [Arthrobacter sp. TMN-50]